MSLTPDDMADEIDMSHTHLETCSVCDIPLGECKHTPTGKQATVAWLVESRVNGKYDGWWTCPPKGQGGWLTQNPLDAKRYTEAEAKAVAEALDYFPSPFNFSHWIATEHVFI